MNRFYGGRYDVCVIGAGHAGIEAALAAARLGCSVLCVTTSLDAVGNMPCNPSIGGTAKGQLVMEIDALGGAMGKAADACGLQFRMLNMGKGPAVHSPRAQVDRAAYRLYMKCLLENTDGVDLTQGEVVEILTGAGRVCGVLLSSGAEYCASSVVVTTGTFLNARTLTGEVVKDSGPDGMAPARGLTDCLERLGLPLRRFKTGTPSRIDGRTVDHSVMERQDGDGGSFTGTPCAGQKPCWLTYTNEKTHEIIRNALDRSPLFTGVIEGVGPRYCPSIEDKVVRFPDKKRHQVFLEPCGEDTAEVYLQGLSSSLPEDVQLALIRSCRGLEKARIMRVGYAIEYDCLDPLCLFPTLESKKIKGLYAAGQVCGSSGYEEAAAQGLVAGANAALAVKGKQPLVLKRSDGYIGTLIDDLCTRGTREPYRMMTSRSEYRLVCRQDNADLRLSQLAFENGLGSSERAQLAREISEQTSRELLRLEKTGLSPARANGFLTERGLSEVTDGTTLMDLLRRPEISYDELSEIDPERPELSSRVREQVEINAKYSGYIRRQQEEIERQKKMESFPLPPDMDYLACTQLRTEARLKLNEIRPLTLGQAARISGVSPSDIGALIMILKMNEKARK